MDHEELHLDFVVFMRKDACWTSMGVSNPNLPFGVTTIITANLMNVHMCTILRGSTKD